MADRIKSLMYKREEKLAKAKGILARCKSENNRALTEDEQASVDGYLSEIRLIDVDIAAEKKYEDDTRAIVLPGRFDLAAQAPEIRNPFGTTAGFLDALITAGVGKGRVPQVDARLWEITAALSTYGNEAAGSDGGFAVPTDVHNEIFSQEHERDSLVPFCRNIPLMGNHLPIPVSPGAPWGTDGMQIYWEGEAGEATQSKPKLELREYRLRKLFGLVPVSNELLEDSAALAAWLPQEMARRVRWKVNNAIVNGAGTGQIEGFVNSGAIVEQAKEGSQVADTIVAANVAKMFGRCTSPSTGVWLINPDAMPQLVTMTIGDQPVWTPVNQGIKGATGGTLLGRPVIPTDACATVGDAGDIYFADLDSYVVATKRGGPKIDWSMHLWFDHDVAAFRYILRIDGGSLVRAAVTPPNSSTTRAPFVRLAARA